MKSCDVNIFGILLFVSLGFTNQNLEFLRNEVFVLFGTSQRNDSVKRIVGLL